MANYKLMYEILLAATMDALTLIEDGKLLDGMLLITDAQLLTMDMEHEKGSEKSE